MRTSTARRAAAAAMLSALGTLGLIAGTAAPASAAEPTARTWKCTGEARDDPVDPGGRTIAASCRKLGTGYKVGASFDSTGERFSVWDSFPNDRATIAYLTVEGFGTATFDSKGDDQHNLSFPEGRSVSLKVCTSSSGQAICSKTYHGGVT